jgi:hypothetical protein
VRNSKRLRFLDEPISRRGFLKGVVAGVFFSAFNPANPFRVGAADTTSPLFWINDIPNQPFIYEEHGNYHYGVEQLLHLMGNHGLKFYRSPNETLLSGSLGLIASDDVVLIKVNAQWKYRGCTNSDLIRGLVQRILDHPNGFRGEVVIFENGQGQGSLNGDALGWGSYPDNSVHANANDEGHSFFYLVDTIFNDLRVSAYLLDPIKDTIIGSEDHATDGYRIYENVSYPCFTTSGGKRVELQEGIWQGSSYAPNLKLINVPVLKHHDTGGSEITASLKHFYGIVSMSDGQSGFRHYGGLGETCGKMAVSIRTPVLNIIDAIWVSHGSIAGYPASTTFRANQILASQDPVALDYWAAKYILYPISGSPRHLPTFPGIDLWLTAARNTINSGGGLLDPENGIQVDQVTKNEGAMQVFSSVFVTETVSSPITLSGPKTADTGESNTYMTAGSVSSYGHEVQYIFDWGDNTDSGWLGVGVTSASHSWGAPATYNVRSKARCASDTSIESDWSDPIEVTVADISFTQVTVLAPDGGDAIPSGSSYKIKWGAPPEATTFNVRYSVDNGVTWKTIASGVSGSNCDWPVPTPLENKKKCRVKVIGYSGSTKVGSDISDTFTIEAIRLTSPNGGESILGGSWHEIRWVTYSTKRSVVKAKIYCTKDNGLTWKLIKAVSGNPGSYNWLVPTLTNTETNCKVKVILLDQYGDIIGSDVSDVCFTIGPP